MPEIENQTNFPACAKRLRNLEEGVNVLRKKLLEEQEKRIKIEGHSRRNNLNFFNIKEEENESMEVTEKKLRNFFQQELKIPHSKINEIAIERAHRLGKPVTGKARPIIAKFSFFKDKEYVRLQAKNLKKTNYGLAEDFPQEILDIRKELVPYLKEAKKEGKRATLKYDRLIIDGKLYSETLVSKYSRWADQLQVLVDC